MTQRRALLNPRVTAIIENEWSQLLRNKVVIFTTMAPPLLIVALAVTVLLLSTMLDASSAGTSGPAAALLSSQRGMLGDLSTGDSLRAALLSPFLVLFQIIPLVVPVTIASYSIVGEKQTRSLEALLATPVRTWELLVGKALSAAIPGVIAAWYSYLLFALAAKLTVSDAVFQHVVLSPTWLISIVLLTPLFTLLAVSLGLIISSRVRDPQSAQQLGSLVILPLVATLVGQVTGAVQLDAAFVIGTALGMIMLDAMLLFFAVNIFGRENILTRWR